jgi:DNA invertase Pin-like site-specific DNA recombinase
VLENSESTERQYALRQRAIALGGPSKSVVVIDSDLGQSGSSSVARVGFQKLVADVGLGQVGIVLGLEVSRLARNSTDWHRLLEICALSDTLILDEDGIYDPSHFNDRLLLGLKGTMSEAELHMLRGRLRGGLLNKARRGELRCRLPIGFTYDGEGRVVLDPDKQVQDSIRLLFKTYFRTGAAHATMRYFRKEGLMFPCRLWGGPRKGELTWGALSLSRIARVLHNPWYAGAYAYGRSRCRPGLDGKRKRDWLPHSEWAALIRDNHPGYITWEEFLKIEEKLFESAKTLHFGSAQTPPREGPALLQGRAICGLCGQRMHVRYGKRREQLIPNYTCKGRGFEFGDALCQSVVGITIDEAIGKLVVESMSPMALELSLAVQREVQARVDESDRLRYQSVERAQHEADAARRRYMLVDPSNRLVADSLEAEWNTKLRAFDIAHEQYEQAREADQLIVSEQQRKQILALTTDFRRVWNDPKTPHRERKRVLGLLVEDVTILKQSELILSVRFRGGATTTLTLDRPMLPYESQVTDAPTRKLIGELANEYNDSEIAHILNERGLVTGVGARFNPDAVRWVRNVQKFRSYKQRLQDAGWLTATEICEKLGKGRTTIRRMHLRGELEARMSTSFGQWLYWPPDVPLPASERLRTRQMDTPDAKGAV